MSGKAENSGLEKYQQKRDFVVSPESKGGNGEIKNVGSIFVITGI